jgi:2,3-bisphosphoglycerate-independent phosphoglycerate mutase
MRRKGLIVLVPATLLVLALFLRGMAADAMRAFTAYETPFAFPAAVEAPAPALTRQVVIVLMDGLGLEASREMPFLNGLRARGADFDCHIGLPSLSLPGRAVMTTGAWQEIHGQATNMNPRRLKVGHLFESARRRGLETLLVANPSSFKMFDPWITHRVLIAESPEDAKFARYEADQRRIADADRARLHDTQAPLAFLEYHLTDEAGHGWGAQSPEYRRAALREDEDLAQLVSELDLTKTTLVVTADHGHIPVGGHGGQEPQVMRVPLVLVGAAIRAGARGDAAQTDIAPTVATLLGIDIPASNQGRPLLDAIVLDAPGRAAALRRLLAQRSAFVRRYVSWVSGGPPQPLPGADVAPAAGEADLLARLAQLDAYAEGARATRQTLESHVRSRQSLVLALLPLAVVAVLLGAGTIVRRDIGRAAAFAVVGQALYYLLLPLAGISYSFSAVNKDEWLERFFLKDMALGVVACAIAVVLAAAWRAHRGEPRDAWDVARTAWLVAGLFCYAFVLKIAFVYWRHGVVLRWTMPDQYWGFGFYLDALAAMATAFAAPLLPLVAWAVGRAWRTAPLRGTAHAA